jgi:hypothetical protein
MSTTTSSAPAIAREAPPLMRKDEKGRSTCGTPRTSAERLYDSLALRLLDLTRSGAWNRCHISPQSHGPRLDVFLMGLPFDGHSVKF